LHGYSWLIWEMTISDPSVSSLKRDALLDIHARLLAAFGPQEWWPGETPFEVMVGAILTQNTNWGNVERAIRNLKVAGLMDPDALAACSPTRLAELIRPSGYFNVKARRLTDFLAWLCPKLSGGVVESLRGIRTPQLRQELLSVRGIGCETADSMLLYALGRRVFVVDAYTRRFLSRHGLIAPKASYEDIRAAFEDGLPRSRKLYNEYHALVVCLGKEFCRPKPRCAACPLKARKDAPALD